MLVNHPQTKAVEPLEDTANKEIVEDVIDVGAGEELRRGHDTSREVVHSCALGLRHRADAFPKENIAFPEHL